MALDVEYGPCPECVKAGNTTSPVGFDSETGTIHCENNHTFDKVPTSNPVTEPEKQTQQNQPAAEVSSETPAQSKPVSSEAIPEKPLPVVAETPKPRIPDLELSFRISYPDGVSVVQRGEPVKLPGNRCAVVVILEETAVSAVQAEAETQSKTFAEYFTEWVNEALGNYWGNLPRPR